MRKLLAILSMVFFVGLSSFGQIDTNYSFLNKKQDYSFETGVSFTKFGKGSSGFTKYISPITSYAVSENLNITFGANIAQSNFNFRNNVSDDNSLRGFDLNSNRLFSDANLRLSPRVTVGGSIFYEYNLLQPIGEEISSTDFDSKGMQLNMNYFISEKASFSLSVGVSEGVHYYDPLYYNSNNFFNNSSFNNSPFNGGMFNNGFGHSSSPFMHCGNIFE